MGVTALKDELEFMIHRRLNQDDGRGMSQANSDASDLTFTIYVSYKETKGVNMIEIHKKSHSINNPLSLYWIEKDSKKILKEFLPLKEQLDLQIISLQTKDYSGDDILLRIHNLNPISKVKVDMNQIFNQYEISNIREKSLSLIYGN